MDDLLYLLRNVAVEIVFLREDLLGGKCNEKFEYSVEIALVEYYAQYVK